MPGYHPSSGFDGDSVRYVVAGTNNLEFEIHSAGFFGISEHAVYRADHDRLAGLGKAGLSRFVVRATCVGRSVYKWARVVSSTSSPLEVSDDLMVDDRRM